MQYIIHTPKYERTAATAVIFRFFFLPGKNTRGSRNFTRKLLRTFCHSINTKLLCSLEMEMLWDPLLEKSCLHTILYSKNLCRFNYQNLANNVYFRTKSRFFFSGMNTLGISKYELFSLFLSTNLPYPTPLLSPPPSPAPPAGLKSGAWRLRERSFFCIKGCSMQPGFTILSVLEPSPWLAALRQRC